MLMGPVAAAEASGRITSGTDTAGSNRALRETLITPVALSTDVTCKNVANNGIIRCYHLLM
jgi:hypothetical protein